MKRCINIDWLELYCLESPIGYPHNADYFRRLGWQVKEREYGTPVYNEMFTLIGTDNVPLLEIRRAPKSAVGVQVNGVLDPMATHIRLTNRSCYLPNCIDILRQFVQRYGYGLSRISRIDLCLDFEKFDYGDDPAVIMRRFMSGKYTKINQANISAHGRDQWDSRVWNSVSWGKQTSMIGTKFYLKTLELAEKADKPYIRRVWQAAGLVDDWYTLERMGEDGKRYKPDIWRVEFSVKSSTRNWFLIEDVRGVKRQLRSIRHTLDMYDTKQKQLDMFLSLADHYFHFKIYEEGKRKDRCQDKLLFRTNDRAEFYKLENVPTTDQRDKTADRLLQRLIDYRDTHPMPDIYKACNVLIEQLEMENRRLSLVHPWPTDELTLARLLMSKRMHSDAPFTNDLAEVQALLQINNDLFGEVDKRNGKNKH